MAIPTEFLIAFDKFVKAEYAKKKNKIASANIEMLLNYLSKDKYADVMKAIIEDDYNIISMRYYSYPVIALTMLGFDTKGNKWSGK